MHWDPQLIGLIATSNFIIAVSYFSIGAALILIFFKRNKFRYSWFFLLFAVPLFLGGTSHIMTIVTVWRGDYLLKGTVDAVAACATLTAAITVWPLLPKLFATIDQVTDAQSLIVASKQIDVNPIRTWVVVFLVSGIFSMCAIGSTLYQQCLRIIDARNSNVHTQTTLAELADTLSIVKDTERDQHGFLLTGKSEYLTRYDDDKNESLASLKRLKEPLAYSEKQEQLLLSLGSLVNEKLKFMDATISERTEKGVEEAIKLVETAKGQLLMDRIRDTIKSMDTIEHEMLQERNTFLDSETQTFMLESACLAVEAIFLFAAFGYFMNKYLTELSTTQKEVTAQKSLFASVLNSISDGVIVADGNGKFLIVNPAAERIGGLDLDQTSPQNWAAVYQCYLSEEKTQPSNSDLPLARAIRGESTRDQEMTIKFPNLAEPVCVNVDGSPLGPEAGIVGGGGVIVFRDITRRKETEQRLREFYAILSHELRSPLTSIRGSLSLIQGGRVGEVPHRLAELVSIAQSEVDRLLRLINDLLDLKKVEAGQLSLNLQMVQPQTIVSNALNALHGMAAEAYVNPIQHVNTSLPIRCDEDRITQVLTNLISNAIKFSPPNSNVDIFVEQEGQKVRFSVKDSGPGIPADQRHKLFQKFQQIEGIRSGYKGTGLGLAIARSLIEGHGGTIGFDSEEDVGSTFWFCVST